MIIRPVSDLDAQDLYGLLALCFAEYPGCVVDPHDDMPDLLRPTSWLADRNGAFWVVEDQRGRVRASIAVDLPQEGCGELHRLYVRPDARREGLASILLELAEGFAWDKGARRMLAWSDTRFVSAHRLYEKRGYRQHPVPRALADVSRTEEYLFERSMG
jgi:putative acetyltransferase